MLQSNFTNVVASHAVIVIFVTRVHVWRGFNRVVRSRRPGHACANKLDFRVETSIAIGDSYQANKLILNLRDHHKKYITVTFVE